MRRILPLVFLLMILCLFQNVLNAQDATLKGKIQAKDHPGGLQGVNIYMPENGLGTISGLHGAYELDGLESGKHVIVFSFIGYKSLEMELEFAAGETRELNIELEEGSVDLSAVSVEARRPVSAASSVAVRDFDLKVRPLRSAQDVLQLVPGLMIAQHAGGGKAEQIFMRGFDADHGTDVGIYVDGMPVNMVTHGHGQGYADLHFVIPEIIEGLEVYKGPYFSEYGNFGTAGSVQLRTTDHPDNNLLKIEGGMFNTAKATTVLKIPTDGTHQSAYLAGQYYFTDGPVEEPQGFQRANLFAKFHTHLGERSEIGLSMGGFSSGWNASGQIPERAVEDGSITRWGSIDPIEGGQTSRYNLAMDYHYREGHDHDFRIQAYTTRYDFKLYSNFTFWLNDPVNGDMIEQNDHRQIYGLIARYSNRNTLGRVRLHTRAGAGIRSDHIDLSLWKSPARVRQSPYTDHQVVESNYSYWFKEDLIFGPKFRIQAGLRGDYFTFDVVDNLQQAATPDNGLDRASGVDQAAILSPSLNLVLSPLKWLDLYLNSGSGFHSNDARDVIIARQMGTGIEVLPRALGAEFGTRIALGSRALISLAAWYLHLEEELVFVGDEGSTEISGETRRIGLDAELRVQLTSFLWADLDLNLADGRYVDEEAGADFIALAPRVSAQGGLNMMHPSGFEASLRFRHIGDRPANEDNSVIARGYLISNLVVAYNFNAFRVFAQLENLMGSTWNEAQFDTYSRLFNETEPVSEIHFTPGNPFNIQAGIAFRF